VAGRFLVRAVLVSFTDCRTRSRSCVVSLVIELLYMAPLIVIARFSAWDNAPRGSASLSITRTTGFIRTTSHRRHSIPLLSSSWRFFACWQPARTEDTVVKGFVRRTFPSFGPSRVLARGLETNSSGRSTMLAVLVLLSLIAFASSMSHQLTPYGCYLNSSPYS